MKKFLIFLIIFPNLLFGQKFTISGFINDQETGELIIGANIFSKELSVGVTTNKYGFYSMTLDKGIHKIYFTYIGYKPIIKEINLNKNIELNIDLESSSIITNEVIVTGESNIVRETRTSVIEVPIEQIKTIPALLGEVDVLKAIQLLPGVQSSEGSSGFYVRGGSPDQNLILMDGVPVYNVSHIGGLFSVFNADAIKNVTLTKGGFPARYGGRLSSVLEIDMKDGNMKKVAVDASIGLISSKLMIEGPIVKNKSSFILAARRTYIDLFLRPFMPNNTKLKLYFYDLNAKLNFKLSRSDRLFVSAYAGDDVFGINYEENNFNEINKLDAKLGYGNITSTIRWNHLFSDKLFSNTTFIYSKYNFGTDFGVESNYNSSLGNESYDVDFQYDSGIEDLGVRLDFDYIPSPDHDIKFGVSFTKHNFTPGQSKLNLNILYPQLDTINSNFNLDTLINFSPPVKAYETFLFIEDNFRITNRLKANIGLHYGLYTALSQRNGNNTKEIVLGNDFKDIQPRLSVRYLLSDNWSIKASYAKMIQNIHLLSNSSVGFPSDLWVPAVDSAPSQNSSQVALSINTQIGNDYDLTLESYYKTMNNLITYKAGYSNLESTESWENAIETNGLGKSYGIEVFLQKKKGRFTGWMGYTLSWSNRKFDNLNSGKWYPYKYDRRNDFSIVTSFKHNENWDFGITWVYGTGNAITFPQAIYLGNPKDNFNYVEYVESYGDRNSVRLPSYHRLDIGLNKHKKRKNFTSTWTFGAYNLYSRNNPFFAYLNYDLQGNRNARQVSLFPLVPSVSFRLKF